MTITSITRNAMYASWTVTYIHEEVERTVTINLNSKTSLLESMDSQKIIPPYALDLIRDELSRKGEIARLIGDDSTCLIRPEYWGA